MNAEIRAREKKLVPRYQEGFLAERARLRR
jgi:hypothetical protein